MSDFRKLWICIDLIIFLLPRESAEPIKTMDNILQNIYTEMSSNSPILIDCLDFDNLKCDLKSQHCPYSPYSEPDCVPCQDTCNPAGMTNRGEFIECYQGCLGYLFQLLIKQLYNRNSTHPAPGPADNQQSVCERGNTTFKWILLAWAVTATVLAKIFAAICLYMWYNQNQSHKALSTTEEAEEAGMSIPMDSNEINQQQQQQQQQDHPPEQETAGSPQNIPEILILDQP